MIQNMYFFEKQNQKSWNNIIKTNISIIEFINLDNFRMFLQTLLNNPYQKMSLSSALTLSRHLEIFSKRSVPEESRKEGR